MADQNRHYWIAEGKLSALGETRQTLTVAAG
jgi:hypothetical protein